MSDDVEVRQRWSGSDRPIPRVVVRPLQAFLATSTSSAMVLFGAVVVALVWANVGGDSYERMWSTPLNVTFDETTLGSDLRFWVNDGLMTVFFLLAGLEIKRQLTLGELRQPRAAALPAIAAIGGMLVPALVYLAVAGGGEAQRGWGIPMATDIALALGALALAASHAPASLKPLLLTLAIVDDVGAIVVIAIFYTDDASGTSLLVAIAIVGAIVLLQRVHVRATVPYVVLGAALWYFTYRAGVHPTIAGVVLGLLTPTAPFQTAAASRVEATRIVAQTSDDPDRQDADASWWLHISWVTKETVSPLERMEHLFLPWSSYLIVPMFALANAGVALSWASLGSAVTGGVGLGIVLGLVVGKPLGVVVAGWLAIRTGAGLRPAEVAWSDLLGMGATAGIGFTVALFIAELAFPDQPGLLAEAKVAIVLGSVAAGLLGQVLLRANQPPAGSRLADASNARDEGHGPASVSTPPTA